MKKTDDALGESVIDAYVSKVAWEDDFILAQQESDPDSSTSTYFYIVDVNAEEVHGPLSESEFSEVCSQMQITVKDSDWIATLDLKP